MGGYGDVQLLRDDGLRLDGRKLDEMRPVSIEAGILPAADGSAMVTHGLNVAVAAVYGPMEAHPRKIQRQDRAVIDVRYNMAPFSTGDRIRPGYNRRSREISKVTAESLESGNRLMTTSIPDRPSVASCCRLGIPAVATRLLAAR